MSKNNPERTVLDVMHSAAMSGDVFLPAAELIERCYQRNNKLTEDAICREIGRTGLVSDGDKLYLAHNYRYEMEGAAKLAHMIFSGSMPLDERFDAAMEAAAVYLPFPLSDEQKNAIRSCMNNRICIISGGAGSGKTTLVHGLWTVNQILNAHRHSLLCSPTGKASRNLAAKARHPAYTVHRALGKIPNSDFLEAELDRETFWRKTSMVIIDEASMITLEMFAGILEQAPENCRIVLVGDENQLLSVGAGNVLNDLIVLGIPRICLTENYRQAEKGGALLSNVIAFNSGDVVTLEFDESFRLVEAYSEQNVRRTVAKLSADATNVGEKVQVLSPFRGSSMISAGGLNRTLQGVLNPPSPIKNEVAAGDQVFRDGDKIILTKNLRDACNGDIGTLHIGGIPPYNQDMRVDFGFSNQNWPQEEVLRLLELAYAITIHKAQGSEYDTVIVPVLRCFNIMLTRNLLYTAISRAKRRLVLVGDQEAISKALLTPPAPRNSALVHRVRKKLRELSVDGLCG